MMMKRNRRPAFRTPATAPIMHTDPNVTVTFVGMGTVEYTGRHRAK